MYGELKDNNEPVSARCAVSAGAVTRRDEVVVDDKVLTALRSLHFTAQMCDVVHRILTRRGLIAII